MITVNIRTSEELKKLRKDYKLSQSKLCEIMGMSRKSYNIIRWKEQGVEEIIDWRAWEKLDRYLTEINN